MTDEDIIVKHKDQTYRLRQDLSNSDAQITAINTYFIGWNVYWQYEVSGLHDGPPIRIVVKNPHYESDGDEDGVWYYMTYDELCYADDIDITVDDAIADFYADIIIKACGEDYEED